MAGNLHSGPVLVQEAMPAPVIDLTASQNPIKGDAAYSEVKPAASTSASTEAKEDWEGESLYEEILDEVDAFEYSTDGVDSCTMEEARTLRNRLHEVGAEKFVFETITSEKYTARKLCTAFGVRIPTFMAASDDDNETFYGLLGLAITRELNKRRRLEQYKTIDDAAKLLRESKNIIVITGAGISTSLGIPDFRSKNTGFYSKLLALGYDEPEDVFDITMFDNDPTVFYKLAGEILPDLKKWSPTHEFIRLLQDKGKLLTNYTQNIDNVEAVAGLEKDKIIQCHGSWATATCRKCKYRIPGDQIFEDMRKQEPAQCKKCLEEIKARPTMKRKRSSNGSKKRRGPGDDDSDSDGAYDIPEPGIMKPDITFFGEQLPNDFFDRLKEEDRDKTDLVIVIGTSMKVAPVSEIPNFLPRNVPQIYISRDPIHHINFDINLLGDCDAVVAEMAHRAGWDLKHEMLPAGQRADVTLVDDYEHISRVKVRE